MFSERQRAKITVSSADWKAKARANKANALSQRTRDAYADQWRWFEAWCTEHNERSVPADTSVISAYLTARAAGGWKVSSLSQGLAGICHQHVAAGHTSPRRDAELNEMWMGLRRSMSSRPDQKAR